VDNSQLNTGRDGSQYCNLKSRRLLKESISCFVRVGDTEDNSVLVTVTRSILWNVNGAD